MRTLVYTLITLRQVPSDSEE